jgi:4-diphosphocytidyl-2C-methyl-D-erythritol kinase
MDRVTKHLHDADLDALANERINMLRHTCLTLFPQLAALRNRIEQLGVGPLQLAGSGGVLFATSTDSDEIARWQRLLHDNHIRQVLPVQFCQNSQPVVEEHHADF